MFSQFINRAAKRVFIVNDNRDCGAEYAPLFRQFGDIVSDPNIFQLQPLTFKLVVFTGGADVSPSMYGDTSPKGICHTNPDRDKQERKIFGYARQRGVRMVGICRGMQFLNVMTGGKMMHDLSGHGGGSHKVMTKDKTNAMVVNSFHHQMSILGKDSSLLAWSNERLSKYYTGAEDEHVDYTGPEVEAFYHSWDKCLGVQWHPEVALAMNDDACKESTEWFVDLVKDHMADTPGMFKKAHLGKNASKINVSEVK